MTDKSTPAAESSAVLLEFSSSIGSFVMLSQKGQLFALNAIGLSRDFSKIVPRLNPANFHPVYPLVVRVKPSNIVLVAHPSDRAQAYFLMDLKAGPTKKTVKVFQEPVEIIVNALEDNLFPILHLGEIQKAVLHSRKNQSPLSVPIRYLELRDNLPATWTAAVKDLFLANAESSAEEKTLRLERALGTLQDAMKTSMFDHYLAKCMWLDSASGYLGKLSFDGMAPVFHPFGPGDAQSTSFVQSLAKKPDGAFEMRQEFANVIPALVRQHPWTSPTLHIYDEDFRAKNKLQEFYSLYQGMRALCSIGAPVLLHQGQQIEGVVPVALLRPSIRGGDITQVSVREFPAKEVVWAQTDF